MHVLCLWNTLLSFSMALTAATFVKQEAVQLQDDVWEISGDKRGRVAIRHEPAWVSGTKTRLSERGCW